MTRLKPKRLWPWIAAAVGLVCATVGCWTASGPEVVVYTALDREFSEPILNAFSQETGIKVLPKYDQESTKTVGLARAIIAERLRPRCDVFWNNEILHTLRLEREGLLDVYHSPSASDFPPQYRSPDGTWHGFAARTRVLIVNTQRIPNDEDRPTSIHDLTDPKWKDDVGMAKPLFGTTATHAACLFAHWGDERAKVFLSKLEQNAKVMSGNKAVARAVASGELAFGLTDTDDAVIELEKAMPVEIVYPDQEEGGLGALFIPNTLAVIKGSRNSEAARRLVDYLLKPEVETRLAKGASAQIPLNPKVTVRSRVEPLETVKVMQVDFAVAAQKWETAEQFVAQLFTAAD